MYGIEGTNILITGGAGFIGSFIADQLIDENPQQIVLVDNLIRGSKNNIAHAALSDKITLIEGDIRDKVLMNDLLKGTDYCFHMAALRINHCVADPRQAFEVMFEATFNIAELCCKHKIKKVVAASSASVYGTADSFPTKEDHHPYHNKTLYGVGKTANEGIFRSFHDMYGLNYNAMRYFNVYGPRMDIHGKYTEVLIRWYDLICEGKRPLIYGDGKQTMDFVYVEDVARANILSLRADTTNQVYNVACGIETSLEELCRMLLKVMGSKLEPEYIPIPEERKKVEVTRRLADTSKAREEIGFDAAVPLERGLGKLVEWIDMQRNGESA